MCRHLAYLGPAAPLARWLFDPPHALVRQASAPRDMRGGGTINADGFGVGWFTDSAPEPLRYRRDRPMWTDAELPQLAARVNASTALAAVRSATPGMPLMETACAPFAADGALFSLNGRIVGWPESVATLAERLPATELLTMEAPTDSVLVWSLLRHRRQATSGAAATAHAMAEVTVEVATSAPGSRLNLLLVEPHAIIATAVTHSLWVHRAPAAVLVSSEPLDDDPGWSPVPDGSLVVATPSQVDITPLPLPGPAAATEERLVD